MKIKIVCAGKIKDKWLNDGINEYVKRLSKYAKVEFCEVPDSPDSLPVEKALEKEGDLMLSRISDSDYVWAMDLHGKLISSEELSERMMKAFEKGGSTLTVVIGGSNGLSGPLVSRANERICLGNITLTHQMTRLIILEQLYRGFKIAGNEKYHK
ncbi:MAG: 23S rRNA (pseudouridine(1915)-N(3))-methyltransferase RlmH [Clostridiales bacterium]|nr:23S rRNA (pseudouridine(1915)-N(3))-methyltransferase RlmH [Clostridiales bacterium]